MKIQNKSNSRDFCLLSVRTYLFLFCSIIFPLYIPSNVHAETESFLPEKMIAEPGETKNNSLTSGSRAVLSFGTSTTFGSNANVSGSSGYKAAVISEMKPTTGRFTSSFGADTGIISATVGNIRSAGSGTFTGDNFTVESTDDASAAEGSANIAGVQTSIEFDFDDNSSTSVVIDPTGDIDAGDQTLHTSNAAANITSNNAVDVNVSTSEFQNAFSQAF